MKRAFILIAIGLLTAALSPVSAYAQVQIAVVGDSNVYGKGVDRSDSYPAKLERALKAKGLNVSVRNSGVNGDTTGKVLARLDSAAPSGTQVAILWVGVNDRKMLGASNAEIGAGRAAIVAQLKAKGIDVINIGASMADLFTDGSIKLADGHLNPAGYDKVVARTIGQVQAAVARAKK
jgi:acyl-CoA thioesterase-1